jgi:hypothetical protein
MEDDALLSEHLAALPEMLEALEAGSDGNWDLLFLDATLVEVPDMVLMFEWTQLAREQGRIHLHAVPLHFTLYGTHSYVVNSGASAVLSFLDAHLRSGSRSDHVLACGIARAGSRRTPPVHHFGRDLLSHHRRGR